MRAGVGPMMRCATNFSRAVPISWGLLENSHRISCDGCGDRGALEAPT